MVIYYYKQECREYRFGCCLQGQSHSEGLYNQPMTAPTVSSELMSLFCDQTYCPVKIVDCCVPGLDHSEHSKLKVHSIPTMPSKPPNRF